MNIRINGEMRETNCLTLEELKHQHADSDNTVAIINGFQTSENVQLKELDEVFFIPKDKLPPENQLEAMMAARHTPGVHAKLKRGRVAIAGLGGLGSAIAIMLARIGVGHLLLVDYDVVEPSNLNRQSYFISHLGMKKTDALQKQLAEINPFIEVKTADQRVCAENAAQLFRGYDIVCEAFDDPSTKAMLAETVLEQLPETIVVAASGMAGYFSSNSIVTKRRFSRLYVCGDMENEAGQGCGLMAPRVQICAGHQANMVLRLLVGINEA